MIMMGLHLNLFLPDPLLRYLILALFKLLSNADLCPIFDMFRVLYLQALYSKCIQIYLHGQGEIFWMAVSTGDTLLLRLAVVTWNLNARTRRTIRCGQMVLLAFYTSPANAAGDNMVEHPKVLE